MTTVTAQAHPNIAFIKYSGEKLGRTNGKVCSGFDV
jgi:mevalonate pyrophosphate decarboxylase